MWFPKKHHYNQLKFTIMKVDLNVAAASKIVTMSNCPQTFESTCGIAYRSY